MPVNYTPPTPEQLLPVRGITLGTAAAGIKRWTRDDVLLVKLSPGSHASGVFTQNRFCAAPVTVCREHLAQGTQTRALLVTPATPTPVPVTRDSRPRGSPVQPSRSRWLVRR